MTRKAKRETEEVLAGVRCERDRQDSLWGEQNCTPLRWLAILGEEVGEVNKAVLEYDPDQYVEELIQVAAVAVAAVASYRRNPKPVTNREIEEWAK